MISGLCIPPRKPAVVYSLSHHPLQLIGISDLNLEAYGLGLPIHNRVSSIAKPGSSFKPMTNIYLQHLTPSTLFLDQIMILLECL